MFVRTHPGCAGWRCWRRWWWASTRAWTAATAGRRAPSSWRLGDAEAMTMENLLGESWENSLGDFPWSYSWTLHRYIYVYIYVYIYICICICIHICIRYIYIIYGGVLKWGYPLIINFYRMFHYKPFWGTLIIMGHFWIYGNSPYIWNHMICDLLFMQGELQPFSVLIDKSGGKHLQKTIYW